MNCKLVLTFLALSAYMSFNAFAGETYNCTGANGEAAGFSLSFASTKQVNVATDNGSEYTLDYARTTTRNKFYGDYEYDGYGGSVELMVPKSFTLSGTGAIEEFKATLKIETYSEAGHVGSQTFKANCQRTDN